MKHIEAIIKKLTDADITVSECKKGETLYGYELSTYTDAEVNQLILIDFRDTKMDPKNAKHFIELYNEMVNDIDIDEVVELNREFNRYKKTFSLTESLHDFTGWKINLLEIFKKQPEKTAQQIQFEHLKYKLYSLVSEMEATLETMPLSGNKAADSQRVAISNQLARWDSFINSIDLEDSTLN